MLFGTATVIYCNLKSDTSGTTFVRAVGKKKMANAALAV